MVSLFLTALCSVRVAVGFGKGESGADVAQPLPREGNLAQLVGFGAGNPLGGCVNIRERFHELCVRVDSCHDEAGVVRLTDDDDARVSNID